MFPGYSNDNADDSDYPNLTTYSGDGSNSKVEAYILEFRIPGHTSEPLAKQANCFSWAQYKWF